MLKLIAKIGNHLIRRGKGLFKILFVIDDFFRLFTMTILIPILFNWIGFGQYLVGLGAALGFVIDVHDFINSQAGIGQIKK